MTNKNIFQRYNPSQMLLSLQFSDPKDHTEPANFTQFLPSILPFSLTHSISSMGNPKGFSSLKPRKLVSGDTRVMNNRKATLKSDDSFQIIPALSTDFRIRPTLMVEKTFHPSALSRDFI